MEREFIIASINRSVKRKIFINDILYCKAQNTYTDIKLIDGNSYLISKALKEFQIDLSRHYFFRISRSYLVNMHHAIEIRKNGKATLKLTKNTDLTIPRSKLKLLEEIIFKKANI